MELKKSWKGKGQVSGTEFDKNREIEQHFSPEVGSFIHVS